MYKCMHDTGRKYEKKKKRKEGKKRRKRKRKKVFDPIMIARSEYVYFYFIFFCGEEEFSLYHSPTPPDLTDVIEVGGGWDVSQSLLGTGEIRVLV